MEGVPWLRGNPEPFLGPFRENIAEFLRLYGNRITLGRCLKKINAWIIPLHAANGCDVLLHVYEERISEDKDAVSTCDCCRNMGEPKYMLATPRSYFARFNCDATLQLQDGKTTQWATKSTTSSCQGPRCSVIPYRYPCHMGL